MRGQLVNIKHSLSRYAGWPLSIILGIASFFLYLPFARLDFDTHHDGLLMSGAIAFKNGNSAHSEFYSQYGPVLPWLQGTLSLFTDHVAVALRLLNVFLISLSIVALAELARLRPNKFPVSRSVCLSAAMAWIAMSDVFGWVPMLPWSSVVALVLTLWAVTAAVRGTYHHQKGNERKTTLWIISAGSFTALLPFTRINVGITSLAVALTLCVITLISSNYYRKLAIKFLASLFLTLFFIFLILIITASLNDWWNQSISEPWSSQHEMNQIYAPLNLFRNIFHELKFVTLALILLVLAVWFFIRNNKNQYLILTSILFAIGINFFLYAFFFIFSRENLAVSGALRYKNPYLQQNNLSFNYLTFLAWSSFLLAITIFAIMMFQVSRKKIDAARFFWWLLLAGMCVSGLTQAWPVPDTRHYWWGLPFGLLLLMLAWDTVTTKASKTLKILNPLFLPTIGALLIAIPSAVSYVSLARNALPDETPAAGMLVSRDFWGRDVARLMREDLLLISRYITPNSKVLYVTRDGHYATLTGAFNSVDERYVAWPQYGDIFSRMKKADFILLERSAATQAWPFVDQDNRLVLQASNDWIALYSNP